ncbi:TIGR01620 family protein [Paracoccus sp. MC1854]|uniref:YcjF family protein n=1 Tax=Paracoccus sp. MC1854 TaxID=2760306 RepID=UPI0016031BD7|nr:TIGR01620 family protein [Paracoccus sp. MC1854]MBB1490301.1 TIGR01620 family protein [Paracoccus sp. MC1854]
MADAPQPPRRGPVLIEYGPAASSAPNEPAPRPEPTEPAPDPGPTLASPRESPASARREPPRDARAPRLKDAPPDPSPADAPPIDDGLTIPLPRPRTMELVTRIVGRRPSRVTGFFLNTLAALLTFLLSMAALEFFDNLMARSPVLGWIGVGLFAAFTLATLALAIREYAAWARLGRIDEIHRDSGRALAAGDLTEAQKVLDKLDALYARRPEMARARQNVTRRRNDSFDAEVLLAMAEAELLSPLDQLARREIEAAARTVAAATALIPLALADVLTALAANLRMIRRMAEIYGGRAGAVGGWRLARTVVTHLIATGAVAAGDDLIHTVAGGGILAKLSRRFGEGVVNGALTARVGIAAMEVCRPLPFIQARRPKVGNLMARGLKGLFGEDSADGKTKK